MKPTVKKPQRCGPCIHFSIVTLIVGPRIRTMFESCPARGQWFSAIAPLPGIARIRSVADCGRASTGTRRRHASNGSKPGKCSRRPRGLAARPVIGTWPPTGAPPVFPPWEPPFRSAPADATVTIQPGETESAGSLSIAAGATLSLPGGGDPTSPTVNWIVNPDFESPIASGNTTLPSTWWQWGSTVLSGQYAHTGSQSLVVSGADSGVTEEFSATPGSSYTASVYAMTAASNPLDRQPRGLPEFDILGLVARHDRFLRRTEFDHHPQRLQCDGRSVGQQRGQRGVEPFLYDCRRAVGQRLRRGANRNLFFRRCRGRFGLLRRC